MPTYIALLRGVNVGKSQRVAMAAWRAQLEALGYSDVATLLNSGNAVFRSPGRSAGRLATAVAAGLRKGFGLDVPVVVKSAKEIDAIVAGNVLAKGASDPSRLLVAFAQEARDLARLEPIGTLVEGTERFHLGREAAYLDCVEGILVSRAAKALLGKAGAAVTTRNWATTLKLQQLAQAGG